jgi:hypothetical protein
MTINDHLAIKIQLEKAKRKDVNIQIDSTITTTVNYLDVLITNGNGQLKTWVYHKPTAEPYYLPYRSDHGLRLGGGWGCPAPPKIKVVSADFFLISLTTLSFLIITQLYEINHIVFFFCLLFLSENLLLLFFSSAGKPTFLFLISARKSTISNLTFCQKVYHFYSLFLSENLLFPILLSAKKCIISILCFCQKIIVHHH